MAIGMVPAERDRSHLAEATEKRLIHFNKYLLAREWYVD